MRPSCPLVSVVVPAYNESENLPELYQQLLGEFAKLDERLELLIVDDGSTDGTLEWLRAVSYRDRRVKFMSFSRNFGHQAAVTAGMQRATGDVLIIMDADLQDPPQVIPAMLQRWREGYQVVRGIRVERESDLG
jgi:glycosyltransferase involved in cell wall biosynthesis